MVRRPGAKAIREAESCRLPGFLGATQRLVGTPPLKYLFVSEAAALSQRQGRGAVALWMVNWA